MPDNADHSPAGARLEGEPDDSVDTGADAGADAGVDGTPVEDDTPPPPPAPLLELRDGLPDVVDTDEGLLEACAALADRKSTRLNSSHSQISYAVFCLKKKKKKEKEDRLEKKKKEIEISA